MYFSNGYLTEDVDKLPMGYDVAVLYVVAVEDVLAGDVQYLNVLVDAVVVDVVAVGKEGCVVFADDKGDIFFVFLAFGK